MQLIVEFAMTGDQTVLQLINLDEVWFEMPFRN